MGQLLIVANTIPAQTKETQPTSSQYISSYGDGFKTEQNKYKSNQYLLKKGAPEGTALFYVAIIKFTQF
jgi:hypothetical protein